MEIKHCCIEIYKLLEVVNENHWIKEFEFFMSELEYSETKDLLRKLLKIYGGMDSFNDLVLYKNGMLCSYENERLDNLRKELYQILITQLY